MIASEREKYLLLAASGRYKKLLKQTNEIIQDALHRPGEWAISFSGGKDSTVMADLLFRNGWRGRGIYFWYSKYENQPENDQQVQWANEHYGFEIIRRKCYGAYDAWVDCGYFFAHPETKHEKSCARAISASFKSESNKFKSNFFIGMCKDESRRRKITLSQKGVIYETQTRQGLTCCPLANWTGTDIWAYIVSQGLPYLSVYDLPHWPREKIRNELTVIYCPDLVLRGEFLQYRMAYPDLFQKLCHEFPEIRQYI